MRKLEALMNNCELEKLLKSAAPPARPPEFWEQFPGRVTASIHWPTKLHATPGAAPRPCWSSWTWGFSAAAACLALAFALGYGRGRPTVESNPQLAQARVYFREIESLFPRQLQAITFDDRGPRLRLADKADIPDSTPLYVKICGPRGCQQHVTFSGQQIRVNGDDCDVLLDAAGNVLLVGRQFAWSSASLVHNVGPYHIEARPLGTSS